MDHQNLLSTTLDVLRQHAPSDANWAPMVAAGVCLVAGLVFLLKGARLAPVLAAIVFGAFGWAGGTWVAAAFSLPHLPVVIVAATVGLALGVVLFKLWFALLVAGCLITVAFSFYTTQVLSKPIDDYFAQGLQKDNPAAPVSLPDPDQATPTTLPAHEQLEGLIAYLRDNVSNFDASIIAIALTTGLAGLVFAFLLPKTARALWAATAGTLLFFPAIVALISVFWPAGAAWLSEHALLIAAVIWALSLLLNLADVQEWRPKKTAAKPAEDAPA